MKKWLTIVMAAVLMVSATSISAFAQKVPNEEDILNNIMRSESPYCYQPMMLRYLAGDMTLTQEHYYYLYYGFAYDDAYNPRATLPGENRILEIFADSDDPSKSQAQVMLEAATENMLIDPFNPGNINMMTFAYGVLGDTINEIISADRFLKVVKAIESSGTGRKENSPWHVLRFTHANDIVASMGYRIENRQVRSRSVEYIKVAKNKDNVKGLFFDFGRVYQNPSEVEGVKRKRKWMLNNIPL